MTVRIVTDSSCDLPQAMADALGIRIVPLSVRFGDTEYIDRTTITATEFCQSVRRLPHCLRPQPPRLVPSRKPTEALLQKAQLPLWS